MPPKKAWGNAPKGSLAKAPPSPALQQQQLQKQQQQQEKEDQGWTKSTNMEQEQAKLTRKSLDFANTAAKVATSVDEAANNLRDYIIKTVHDNNVLGLPDEEIKNMAKLLMQTPNKTEIYEWASTLMQPKTFAEEIIKQRDIAANRFAASQQQQADNNEDNDNEDDDLTSISGHSIATTTASTATARRKGGKGARGKQVSIGNKKGTENQSVLVEGSLFECGCFGTAHDFRSNCMNCGRIFCMQESDEVCYSCQLPPQSCLALDLKQTLGRISDASDRKDREGFEMAIQRRDQLLQFAKERSKRTSIIDDQSGVHRADPWSSKAERAKSSAAEEAERQKIADMHKRTGAVAVHLDIVNQCVQLGATPLTKEKSEEEKQQEEEQRQQDKAQMGLGFAQQQSAEDDKREEANVCAGISSPYSSSATNSSNKNKFTTSNASSKPMNLQKKAGKDQEENDDDQEENNNNNQQGEDDENIEENDIDDLMMNDGGARRVIALPSLVQQIFYCETEQEAAEKTKIKASLKQSQNAGSLQVGKSAKNSNNKNDKNEDGGSGNNKPRKVDFRRAEDLKTDNGAGGSMMNNNTNEKLSRRVQVDYFEADNDTWIMSEQQDQVLASSNDNSSSSSSAPSNTHQQKQEQQQKQSESGSSDHKNRFAKQQDERFGEKIFDNERLLHMTVEDAVDWKANSSSSNEQRVKGFNNSSENNDDNNNDTSSIPRQSLTTNTNNNNPVGGILFQLQQQSKRLYHKDEGWCLSMHQPWASLLIAGIKTHEGRTWSTEWRGRLWIHAAAAKPTQESIDEVEGHARQFVPDDTKFPTNYPTKCLLGCVALVDCMDRDRYESAFPPEQRQLSEQSTHCFYCMVPKALPFPLAMDGNHKIYKLDKKHWQAARKLFKETA